jgi:copper chaperone CopZ
MNTPLTYSITGMTCGNCAAKIQKRLGDHPDIQSAHVSLQPPQAVVESSRGLPPEELNRWLEPLGHYRVSGNSVVPSYPALPPPSATTYKPLLIVLGYLTAVTAGTLVAAGGWDWMMAMRIFMGGFFIAFSFFKMLDLRGFSDAYRGYDVVAKAWPGYGFVYPFIELGLGIVYIANVAPWTVNLVTAVVMAVSLAGVMRAVLSKRTIRCACLGTVFQLPMSTVTIIEDGLMLAMAVAMLLTL